MPFVLDPRLEKDTHFIGKSGNCQLLLKDNAVFPWILIVPETPEEIEHLHHLPADQFAEVVFLIRQVSEFMCGTFESEKINVACLGNIIPQMHVHLVVRSSDDPAWPDTVWDNDEEREKYPAEQIIEICVKARLALGLDDDA